MKNLKNTRDNRDTNFKLFNRNDYPRLTIEVIQFFWNFLKLFWNFKTQIR